MPTAANTTSRRPASGERRAPAAEDLQRHSDKELLRFLTCGSVDDGKSTLIGRLLLEAGAVYDDQLAALAVDSARHGTTGAEIDTALLVDGLEDERQQGITIDVAYRYFATPQRKFIIADTPGHEQFTRNMATGASTSDLAVIVVDASKGILTQTKRHAFIVSMLGIKHVILAVNKMDLVDYSQAVFQKIADEFGRVARQLQIPDVRFVPLSALRGDNVAQPSAKTLWYADGSLLHLLETVFVSAGEAFDHLRFPVQWVNRPHADFRGFSGSIASGELRVGDEIMVLPSRKRSRVRSIVTMDGELDSAIAPAAVTVTLADEIDVARGDMLVHPATPPAVAREAEAALVWMSEQSLALGKQYWCKHASKKTSCEIVAVRHAIDVNSQSEKPASTLKLNELGICRVRFLSPLAVDEFDRNRATGSFILVDRITHETVAAGMIRTPVGASGAAHWNDQPVGLKLEYAVSRITPQQRANQYGHRPGTILITGLSGAGKTTLALELEEQLVRRGCKAAVLDGQSLRFGISRDLGFSAEERSENLRRGAEIAKWANDAGQICIAAFVAPEESVRQRAKDLIGPDRLLHVHLDTPLDVCRSRDTQGRYSAADAGQIDHFPGVTFPYERPAGVDLVASTADRSAASIAGDIVELLVARGFLGTEDR